MAERGTITYRRFTEEFRRRAVSRLEGCRNISALCRELGISRQLLYQWKHRSERGPLNWRRASVGEDSLRRRVTELEHAVAEMRLQMDDYHRG